MKHTATIFLFFLITSTMASAQTAAKELYIPAKIFRIPENNDYHNDTSAYSYKRMVQSDNIAIFWHKEFGDNPAGNPDPKKRFAVQEALQELERFYNYYVNELKLVQKRRSSAPLRRNNSMMSSLMQRGILLPGIYPGLKPLQNHMPTSTKQY